MYPFTFPKTDTGPHGRPLRSPDEFEGKGRRRFVAFQHQITVPAPDRVHQHRLVDIRVAGKFGVRYHVGPYQTEHPLVGWEGQVAFAPERYALVGVHATDHGNGVAQRAMRPEPDGFVGTVDEAVEYAVGQERQENEGPHQFQHAVVPPGGVRIEQLQSVHLLQGPVCPGPAARGMGRDGQAARFRYLPDQRG